MIESWKLSVFFDKLSISLTKLYKYLFSRIMSPWILMEGLIPLIYKAVIKRKKSKHNYRCLSRSNSNGDIFTSAPSMEDHQPHGFEMAQFTHMFMTPPPKKLSSFGELGCNDHELRLCYTRHSSMKEFNRDGLLSEKPHVRQVLMNKFSRVRSLRVLSCVTRFE